jgi:beta-mannosidase
VLKHSQEPVCLLLREPQDGALALVCANDTLETVTFAYRVIDVTNGREVAAGEGTTDANTTASVCNISYAGDSTTVYLIEWTRDGKGYRNHYVSGSIPHDYETVLDGYRKVGLLDLYVK